MARGVLSGHPIVDVRVELYDGAYHDTGSTEEAFKAAAAMAFRDAAQKARPVVVEPVMQVVVAAKGSSKWSFALPSSSCPVPDL